MIVPDVLLQSHMASLDMTFYDGDAVPDGVPRTTPSPPSTARGTATPRTGYKVIRVPMKDGKATGEYEDFLVGFVTKEGDVWGRPVGVAVAKDGSLLVTDDGSGTRLAGRVHGGGRRRQALTVASAADVVDTARVAGDSGAGGFHAWSDCLSCSS